MIHGAGVRMSSENAWDASQVLRNNNLGHLSHQLE